MGAEPSTGGVFFCEQFPGLHGHAPKDRYAVVISPPERCPDERGHYLVVPTSASTMSGHRLRLPNQQDNPGTRSGLPRRCWAVCDEYRLVTAARLTQQVGSLRIVTVTRLQELVMAVVRSRIE